MKRSVCVVGGGASGMMAAIAAGRCGAKVTLLEHRDRIGRKILLTGNGKCNLTNLQMDPSAYEEKEEDSLPAKVLAQFDQTALMTLFESMGMRLMVNRESYVYPETESAATVVNVLRRALEQNDVICKTGVTIHEIKKEKQFCIHTDQGIVHADCVILACGGKSYPKTGSDGSGYRLAKELGIKVNRDYPALTSLICRREGLKTVAGLRQNGKVTLYIDGRPVTSDIGQIQFTDYGISGIPVFQVSTQASMALSEHRQVAARISLFPDMTSAQVMSMLQKQCAQFGDCSFEETMNGILHKKWIDYFGKYDGLCRFTHTAQIPDALLWKLAEECTSMLFPVEQVKGYDFCQVTGGGVAREEVDEHLASLKIPGLYIVGEMLDVVGKCGGYNLQWAFSTGYIAGCHAAGSKKDVSRL